jgi:uncharacterized protein
MKIKLFSTHFLIIIFSFALLIILANFLISTKVSTPDMPIIKQVANWEKTIPLVTANGVIDATIASTSEDWDLGLSGLRSMDIDKGMIFIFPHADFYRFWMKDMYFPLDIVWIDSDKKIVDVDSNVSPESYPNIFLPPVAVRYVLELNAGMAEKYGLVTGTKINFVL